MNIFTRFARAVLWLVALGATTPADARDRTPAIAWSVDHWRFQTSLYTKHFDREPDHDNTQQLIDFMVFNSDGWHAGLAFFDNSFGQPSQYLYAGKAWDPGPPGGFYWRLSGGLLHGYKDENQGKIPFNGLGVAPALVPALGFRHRRFFAEYHQIGLAAGMITVGFTFGHASSGKDD